MWRSREEPSTSPQNILEPYMMPRTQREKEGGGEREREREREKEREKESLCGAIMVNHLKSQTPMFTPP
jgi:hypothetical protein